MNRRKFLRNSFLLTAFGAVSQNLWANPMTGSAQLSVLPKSPLHIRHGLLQEQAAKPLLSQCRWLLGLQHNSFLRNGLEPKETAFHHYDLQLDGTQLGIGLEDNQLWLCDETGTLASTIPSTHSFSGYHLVFEQLAAETSFSPSSSHQEWLLLPLSGALFMNGQKVKVGELYFIKNSMISILTDTIAKFLLVGK